MDIVFAAVRTAPAKADAVVYPVFAEGAVPRSLGMSRAHLAKVGFDAKPGQTHSVVTASGVVAIALGMGSRASVSANGVRDAAANAARAAARCAHVAIVTNDLDAVEGRQFGQAVAEGVVLASYRFVAHRSNVDIATQPAIALVSVVVPAERLAAIAGGLERGAAIANAVTKARDLINTSPAQMTATEFANRAAELAKAAKLAVTVHETDALSDMRLGGIVSVNRGSSEPARLVRLEYNPRNAKRTIALVGKGVMYDSGGISLKPSDASHASMKMDMSGAAAVLAAMTVLPVIKAKVRVIAYLCCVENMPSGSALRMGEVITIRNGKTVEIHNTDAEGRLILADGLSLAVEDGVDAIVDIATLTGACMAALGQKYAGLLSNHDGLAAQVLAAATRADEPMWRLPLVPEYRKLLDSEVADMKNIGGPYGGAITAALFLQEFVGTTPWAHIDMAGPMRVDSDDKWLTRGGTAYGARTFVEFVDRFESLG